MTLPHLNPRTAVAAFMRAFHQPVRTTPTDTIPNQERLLRARLVVEEAIEFAAAMGCTVAPPATGPITPKTIQVDLDPNLDIDLVEAADALADLTVVVEGSAHTLGIPSPDVFDVVHATNMAKLGPDGTVLKDPVDGKVRKPAGWQPPTAAIRQVLLADGWQPRTPSGTDVAA